MSSPGIGLASRATRTRRASSPRRRLKGGVFPLLVAPQDAINHFIEHDNQEPKAFAWKACPVDSAELLLLVIGRPAWPSPRDDCSTKVAAGPRNHR
jgi:hypothetical protein